MMKMKKKMMSKKLRQRSDEAIEGTKRFGEQIEKFLCVRKKNKKIV